MADPVYATVADLAALGLNAIALSSIPSGSQTEALSAASRVVDSYLRSQFTLPLVQWGTDVTRATCLIAAYDLMTSRGFNPDAAADVNVRMRFEDATRWLEKCASGAVVPSVTDSTPGATQGSVSAPVVVSGYPRGYSSRGSFWPNQWPFRDS